MYRYIYYIYTIYIYPFFSDGGTLKFKMEGRKGLPILKCNMTRLMGSCCYIKICQHKCFFADSVNLSQNDNFKLARKF